MRCARGQGLGLLLCAVMLTPHFGADRLELARVALGLPFIGALSLHRARRSRRSDPRATVAMGALLLVVALRPLWWADRAESWLPLLGTAAVFHLARQRPRAPHLGLRLALAWLVGQGWLQGLGLLPHPLPALFPNRPVMGPIGNPTFYGALLPPLLALVWGGLRRPERGWLIWPLTAFPLVASGSRTAMVGGSLVALGAALRPGRGRARWGPLLGAAAAILTLLLWSGPAERVHTAGSAFSARLFLWRAQLPMVWQAGISGGGPGAFRRLWPAAQALALSRSPGPFTHLHHAHSDLIELVVDLGLLGLALWAGLLATCWQGLRSRTRHRNAAGLALASGLVMGLALPQLFFLPSAWLLALAAGLCWPSLARARERKMSTAPEGPRRIGRCAHIVLGLLFLLLTGSESHRLLASARAFRASFDARSSAEAHQLLDTANRLRPEDPLPASVLASLALDSNDPDSWQAALQALDRARPTQPIAELWELRSRLLRRLGRHSEADACREHAVWLRGPRGDATHPP